MALNIGIIGLPQSGKSTLFQALTARGASGASGEKRKANLARVPVPDERLWKLSSIFNPKKTTPATIDFMDIGALDTSDSGKEQAQSSALGDKLIADIRTVDLLLQVVRCFPHQYLEGISPISDFEELELELYLSDLKIIENRLEKSKKMNPPEKELLESLKDKLSRNEPAKPDSLSDEQQKMLSGLALLHLKPRIVVGNISDNESNLDPWNKLQSSLKTRNIPIIGIPAKIEAEIGELSEEEQSIFLHEMGIKERGLDQLIRECYNLLGLMTFFTVGEDEVRSWTIKKNTRAQVAAGKIHSDLERGFIRAETISYEQFIQVGTLAIAKDKGWLRMEGKDYLVLDGDIINVRFNV